MITWETSDIDKPCGRIFKFKWNTKLIPKGAYIALVKLIAIATDYGPVTPAITKKLSNGIKLINKEYKINLTVPHALSLHHIIAKDKIIHDYPRLNRMIKFIAAKYNPPFSIDILTLAKKYDFPPLNLLRSIMIANGVPERDVFKAFNSEKSENRKILAARDLAQLKIAEKNDADSRINQDTIYKSAMDFEESVVKFFLNAGVRIKTQDQLAEQQTKRYGRAVITPDLLFLDHVYINDVKVTWLDCKNYMGNEIGFIRKSNVNQAAKYGVKWGPGVVLYRYSALDTLSLPSAIVLSWQ